jgi:hypothetical protein
MKPIIITLTLLTWTIGLFFASVHVNAWEKANDYPYGKMCNSIFTGYVDTCKH